MMSGWSGPPPCFPGHRTLKLTEVNSGADMTTDRTLKRRLLGPRTPVAILSAAAAMPWEMGRMAAATILIEEMFAAPT